MLAVAVVILLLDQVTKYLVLHLLSSEQEHVIVDGFFKFVCWGNKGAAWSIMNNSNLLLAFISIGALCCLIYWRERFDTTRWSGQCALGLVFGGIVGNLFDRLHPARQQVIDFLRFYMYQRDGREIGFPAFNIADSAICCGVALLILMSWLNEKPVQA